jgi:hypothetical protein
MGENMRRLSLLTPALAVAALFATPVSAAENLSCMAEGYTAEQNAAFASYLSAESNRVVIPTPPEVEAALGARVAACAATHSWSAAAQQSAVRYRRAALLQARLRRNSPASEQSLAAMDRAIDASDQASLRRTMERLRNYAAGQGPGPDGNDIAVIMPIYQASGLPMNGNAGEFIGAWLATRIAESDLRAEFASQ